LISNKWFDWLYRELKALGFGVGCQLITALLDPTHSFQASADIGQQLLTRTLPLKLQESSVPVRHGRGSLHYELFGVESLLFQAG